jgi:hypothetical protein
MSSKPVVNGTVRSCVCADMRTSQAMDNMEIVDFSPEWDFTVGGSKVIVTCRETDSNVTSTCNVCIMFDKEQVISLSDLFIKLFKQEV